MKKKFGKVLFVEAILILVFGFIGSIVLSNQKNNSLQRS